MSSMDALPGVVPATPTRTRPERESFASPTDIKPKTPTARRMSMSSTSQSAVLVPRSILDRILDWPQAVLAGLITLTTASGIAYSLVHSTSLDTSLASHVSAPERSALFARKSNLVNQYFVKLCWGWTCLVYLVHLFTAPSSLPSTASHRSASRTERRRSRLAALVLATAIWYAFTSWCFGAGVGDRIIALSGGDCAVPLPDRWNLDLDELARLFPDLPPTLAREKHGDHLYLPLPHAFCHSGTPLTPTSHPDLFALLSSASPSASAGRSADALHPTASHPDLVLLRPRWHRGFDVSGHTFLLTMSALLLARELAPSWRAWAKSTPSTTASPPIAAAWRTLSHRAAAVIGTALVALWAWMLLMTAIYFHHPPEKISGLVLGLVAVWAINLLIPVTLFSSQPPDSDTTPDRPRVTDNENAARRGLVVDDGVIEEDEHKDDSPTRKKNQ